jgi:hypothetical protein
MLGEGGTGKGRRAKETRELTKKLAEGGKEEREKDKGSKRINKKLGEGGAGKGRRGKETKELTRSWEKEEQGKGDSLQQNRQTDPGNI